MEAIAQLVIDAAGSPWVYPIVFLLTISDAFLVIAPSEIVVVALGSLATSTGQPQLGILLPVVALAAVIGDTLTYAVGRRIGITRFAWMRSPRVLPVLGWAARALDRRAASVLLTARFIPFGRIAVNLTAGATNFPYRRFLGLTAIAGVCWAIYNTVVGALFGRLLGDNPVLAVATSVVVAIAIGLLIDAITGTVRARRGHTDSGEHSGGVSPPEQP